mgnify:CR=1 FL=1
MSLIIFYEKHGCKTNAKQKQSFRDAGCKIIERDLLNHGMSKEELHEFFKNMPVTKWFNPSAPLIKSGKINPVFLKLNVPITMTKHERLKRLTILFQQLEMIQLYPDSFHENLGKRGTKEFIDEILDEINLHRQALKNN